MHILLTNDDGIYAEGIYAIYQELIKFAKVTVVAPDSEKSSVGHGITLAHPIWFKKVNRRQKFFGYGISGTPADCVKFAICVLMKDKPDIIVSGINLGQNDGCSVHYSGTVAGAREGALLGFPSIALSLGTFVDPKFKTAAQYGAKLVKLIYKHSIPKNTFLNVNIPHVPKNKIKGMRITSQGLIPIHGDFHKRVDPNLRTYYWMTGKAPAIKDNNTVDTNALAHNYVTITPIHCDITNYQCLSELTKWNLK